MIDRIIEERRKRYDQLHKLLADPKVIGNSSEYQSFAKELAGLTPIMHAYDQHLKLAADLKELNKALDDKTHDKE
ncbi:MAG: PCRF domain-containing protein, partial [Candidatus Omnitrophica bacterium]|nr:PCRF domain-containing protein [Candidatus Omnitrophota bacterium]